jgi:hypothetical protein
MTKVAAKIKIEKNVPIPGKTKKKQYAFPFEKMDVGDSFSVPFSKSNYSKLYLNSKRFTKDNSGFRFTLRKNETENWIRIWRVQSK